MLIIIFGAGTVLWLCYWALVRPFILDSVEEELARMQSCLDWAVIEGANGSSSGAAEVLARNLRGSKSVRWISLGQAVYFRATNQAWIKASAAKEREIFQAAPTWIKDMRRRQAELAIKASLANSPMWWLLIAVVLVGALFSKAVAQLWEDTEVAAVELQAECLPASA